jgi:signal transduction histidine kinase
MGIEFRRTDPEDSMERLFEPFFRGKGDVGELLDSIGDT